MLASKVIERLNFFISNCGDIDVEIWIESKQNFFEINDIYSTVSNDDGNNIVIEVDDE